MNWLVYIYLAGFAAHVVLSHGVLSNPTCSKTNPSLALAGAILWPLMLLVALVELTTDEIHRPEKEQERS